MGVYVNNERIAKDVRTPIHDGDVINISVDRRTFEDEAEWKKHEPLSFILKNDLNDRPVNKNSNGIKQTKKNSDKPLVEKNKIGIDGNGNLADIHSEDEAEDDQPLSKLVQNINVKNASTSLQPMVSIPRNRAIDNLLRPNFLRSHLNDAFEALNGTSNQTNILKRKIDFSGIKIPPKIPRFNSLTGDCNLSPRDNTGFIDEHIYGKFINSLIHFNIDTISRKESYRGLQRVRTQYYDNWEEYER